MRRRKKKIIWTERAKQEGKPKVVDPKRSKLWITQDASRASTAIKKRLHKPKMVNNPGVVETLPLARRTYPSCTTEARLKTGKLYHLNCDVQHENSTLLNNKKRKYPFVILVESFYPSQACIHKGTIAVFLKTERISELTHDKKVVRPLRYIFLVQGLPYVILDLRILEEIQ